MDSLAWDRAYGLGDAPLVAATDLGCDTGFRPSGWLVLGQARHPGRHVPGVGLATTLAGIPWRGGGRRKVPGVRALVRAAIGA